MCIYSPASWKHLLFLLLPQSNTITTISSNSNNNATHDVEPGKGIEPDDTGGCLSHSKQPSTLISMPQSSTSLLTTPQAQGGKDMSSGGFAARAQAGAAANANNAAQQGGQGQASSGKK